MLTGVGIQVCKELALEIQPFRSILMFSSQVSKLWKRSLSLEAPHLLYEVDVPEICTDVGNKLVIIQRCAMLDPKSGHGWPSLVEKIVKHFLGSGSRVRHNDLETLC